jgi:TetR/AcrR family transcriptional regulator, transcriptional repressor for nem operon
MIYIIYKALMRYPPQQKERTRARLVHMASRRFRRHGAEGVAIADLMRELKLTHGGFYRHFDSKEQLFAEAVERGFEEVAEKLMQIGAETPPGGELKAIIEAYLSPEHCANPAEGCLVAALAQEIARHPRAVRLEFEGAMRRYGSHLAKFLPGKTDSERQANFLVLFSGMAGALGLARAVVDESVRHQILQAARKFYIKSFCG